MHVARNAEVSDRTISVELKPGAATNVFAQLNRVTSPLSAEQPQSAYRNVGDDTEVSRQIFLIDRYVGMH
jgi:hypothetical protein